MDRHNQPTKGQMEVMMSRLSWPGNRYIPNEWTVREVNFSRQLIRNQVFIDAGGLENPITDFGQPNGAHYHELVNRMRTPDGTFLRWLAYQPELCAVLSIKEHDRAHTKVVRDQLFQIKYRQYGYDNVKYVFDLIQECSVIKQSIRLPKPKY